MKFSQSYMKYTWSIKAISPIFDKKMKNTIKPIKNYLSFFFFFSLSTKKEKKKEKQINQQKI
jgi:hypothetical protein